jgi:hypothetical protein
MVPPFDFIDQLIWENHWDYLFHCSGIVYPRLVRDFYGYLEGHSGWAELPHFANHSQVSDFQSWCCTYWDYYQDWSSSFWGRSFPRFCGFPFHRGVAHVFWFSALSTRQSPTLSGFASFPHRIVFLRKLCNTIYGPQVKEWASLQKGKISIFFDSTNFLLSLQGHCAYYTWDAWWVLDKSPLCMPCHKDLHTSCSRHFCNGAKGEDQGYHWKAYCDEIQCSAAS